MQNKTTVRFAQWFGLIALIAVIGFSMTTCGDGNDPGGGTAVTFSSADADGSASQTSTELTLVFSQAITGLSAADITLSGVTGVSKGTLSNTGATYTLPISGFITGGTLNIAVSKTGYSISGSPQTVTIYYYGGSGDTAVTFSSANANGSASRTSTELTLVFSQAITGLSAANITLSGVTGVSTGTLSNTGATYTLPISGFTTGGTLNIAVSKTGYSISGSPQTATIYCFIEMVQIQGGPFTMGSPENEPNRDSDETQHEVTLTGFYMGKYQVTQAQYRVVMGTNPSAHSSGGSRASDVTGLNTENFPVERVSWYDALVFCNKLSMNEGLSPAYRINGSTDPAAWGTVPESSNATWNAVEIVVGSTGYRLPTEAQWEYACRAGTWGNNYSAFNTGNNITTAQANYDGNYPYNNNPEGIYLARTTEVGSFASNAYGLYDMHGNVFELCWDWYGTYAGGTQTDPTGAGSGTGRMVRGGSWDHDGQYLRSAYRDYLTPPSNRSYFFGFRVVRP
jgi:formylglycine-generating enzyme required for sulfatase activity